MKKIDLSNCTFIIPIRLDSGDRTRNITTVLCYLLKTFNTKVILKEVDSRPFAEECVIKQIKEFLDKDEINNLIYLFEESDSSEFHRMKILNENGKVYTELMHNACIRARREGRGRPLRTRRTAAQRGWAAARASRRTWCWARCWRACSSRRRCG